MCFAGVLLQRPRSQLTDAGVDQLLYVLTGVAPDTKCAELGSKVKGSVRDGFRRGLGAGR